MITTEYKYPIVTILWDDAESTCNWMEEPMQPLKPTLAMTIGFMVRDEPEHVLVADSYFIEGRTIGNTNKIPRGMIKELKYL